MPAKLFALAGVVTFLSGTQSSSAFNVPICRQCCQILLVEQRAIQRARPSIAMRMPTTMLPGAPEVGPNPLVVPLTGAVARTCAIGPNLTSSGPLGIRLACLMPCFRCRVGGGDDRPFRPTRDPPRYFRPIWSRLDSATCASLLPALSQTPEAHFCNARSLVLSVGSRRAQRSSFVRRTRAVPSLLSGLPGGYRA